MEKAINWGKRAQAIDPDEPPVQYNMACIYSLAGKIEQALDCFELADPIRDQPRFQKALKKLN
jgi:tetratricopeptide (TPR) repeat protein